MLILTFPLLWSFSYFYLCIYVTIVFSAILYAIPSIKEILNYTKFKKINNFEYVTGLDLYWLFCTPIFLFLLLNFVWVAPSVSAWFGNLIFTSFQSKISYLIILIFYLIITTYSTSFYFSSKEIYDYMIVCFNFFIWIFFLFSANSVFTFIFFVEILSTLIFLLLITSTFSSTFFYNNLNFNLHNYFSNTAPFFFVQMLLYFFWISLVSSLNLFLFLILFYIKFFSFDWFFFEFIFFYLTNLNQSKDMALIIFIWLNLLFCIFLKCGLVPFYFWKPVFFKGIPVHALFFYILFFYFFIFLYFIYFFLVYMHELFYFLIGVNIILLIIGFFILVFILCEAFYIKAFLALSSVLNTLFAMLALSSVNLSDFVFLI